MATQTTAARSAALEAPSGNGETRFKWQRFFVFIGYGLLIFFAFLEIAPFVMTVASSFKCEPAISTYPAAFIPIPPLVECQNTSAEGVNSRLSADAQVNGATFSPTTNGYNRILGEGAELPRWALNTMIYSVVVTIMRLLFDSMAGYALARFRFPGNRVLFFIVLGTLMIPGVVLLIPRFLMLKEMGLLNTYWGYFLVLGADAFGILLMKQFFENIPKEIEEAASVDGSSRFTTFFRIVLPMATPALVALTIFSFQGQWNNFMDALIIVGTNTALYNLPMGLTILRGSGQDLQFDLILAGSVITTLPMAVIFFIFQRYFVEGVSYSGIKG